MVKEKPDKGHISPEPQKITDIGLTREKVTEALNIMGIKTSGSKYVRVEEGGSLSFNRDFMIHVLKERGVEILPKMSNEDITKQFTELIGKELEFFTGAPKIQAKKLPKPFGKPAELPANIKLPRDIAA